MDEMTLTIKYLYVTCFFFSLNNYLSLKTFVWIDFIKPFGSDFKIVIFRTVLRLTGILLFTGITTDFTIHLQCALLFVSGFRQFTKFSIFEYVSNAHQQAFTV